MPGRERRSSRRMDEDEDDTGPSRSRRTRRSASSVESDEEDELVPSRRSSRARKAIKDSDQEDEAQMSDEEESDDARGKRGKKRAKAAQDDGEWDEEEDNDDDEEDDWVRDAKEVLGKLKKNRDCQNIFFEPVDAEALGLTDYHTVITQPMDLGTVTEKLGDGKYAKEEEFCQDVMLTFNNAMTYNSADTEIHLVAVRLRKKFRDLWTKARPESNFNETLDSSELNGRFWADDREAQTSRRSSRRSGESNERGAGARDAPRPRGRLRQGVGSDSDDSGIIESKEEKEEERGYRLRERTRVQPVVPEEMGQNRRQSKSSIMQRSYREVSGGRGASVPTRKSKLFRPSTVVSEMGRKMRIFDTDASESGEDVPSKNAHLPYETRVAQGGGGDFEAAGGGYAGGGMGGGGGGSKVKDKAKDEVINADISTMEIDESVSFASIGGLDGHIRSLKESVFLPLTYPEVFEKLGVKAPGGVLFHGPPGTGKTMMARALANSCSQGDRKISFFMRKGADCLSKYHGEAERQLRLLFEQAALKQPSIIFFDEIDGLAPVRSSRQDQIHSSIVSTLLALMDGLDKRGMVVCVGATNRPDAVDPALRRPGRFDREFYFPLPDASARAKLLEIYTKDWQPPLSAQLINRVANACVGFGGADMKALCTEAGVRALRRTYPQIYMEDHRLKIDKDKLFVTEQDISDALARIKCSSTRSSPSLGVSLPASLRQPLQAQLVRALEKLSGIFAAAGQALSRERLVLATYDVSQDGGGVSGDSVGKMTSAVHAGEDDMASLTSFRGIDIVHRPRVLLWGRQGDAQGHIARAMLQALDPLPIFSIGLQALYTSTGSGDAKTLEEALVFKVSEARNRAPSVLYLPDYHTWIDVASQTLRTCLECAISALPASAAVLVLASCDTSKERTVISWIQRGNIKLFTNHHLMEFEKPSKEQLQQFFNSIVKDGKTWRKPQKVFEADLPKLERCTELPKWEKPEEPIDAAQKDRNERSMRGIRMKMREKCEKLYKNRKFKDFQQPVLDNHALPENVREAYRKCIKHPMDLYSLLREINMQIVRCPAHFRERIKLIHDNAYKFNGPDGPVIEASPTKVKGEAESRQADKSGKMYKIPDSQEQVLKDGTILEVSVRDMHTNDLEWVPCKISEVNKSSDDQVTSFTVHVIIEREDETGTWNDTYNLGAEGVDWRWPEKKEAKSMEDQDLEELELLQKNNAKICSNATALLDESEEELCKIDSWLVEETDRLAQSTGYVLGPPNREMKALSAVSTSVSRNNSQSKTPAIKPTPASSAHSSQQSRDTRHSNRDAMMASQAQPHMPLQQPDSYAEHASKKRRFGNEMDGGMLGGMAGGMPMGMGPGMGMGGGQNMDIMQQQQLMQQQLMQQRMGMGGGHMDMMQQQHLLRQQQYQQQLAFQRQQQQQQLQLQQEQKLQQQLQAQQQGMGMGMNGHGMAAGMQGGMGGGMQVGGMGAAPFSPVMIAGGGNSGGADAVAVTTMQQSGQPLAAEKKEDPTLIYDYVEKDPGLAEELNQFVENLIDEGKDKSWEQLLELHSSLYAVIARHEHQHDRFCALADMRDSLDQWRRRCSADAV